MHACRLTVARAGILVGLAAGFVGRAAGQNTIQWASNIRASIAAAQRTLHPLLFYVPFDSRSRRGLVSLGFERSLRDPLINAIIYERFVPVRLQRSTDTVDFLAQAGAPTAYGGYLLVTAPNGESLGVIGPEDTSDPAALANALTAKFRAYRDQLYVTQLKPIIEEKASRAPALLRALRLIRQFIITSAAKDLEKLAERPALGRDVRTALYDTLAVLSTEESTTLLFDAALQDRSAARALKRSTPAAAERLLKELKLDNDTRRLAVAYDAVTAIAKVPNAKPEGFWKGPNEHVKEQELERVKELVERTATQWQQRPVAVLR